MKELSIEGKATRYDEIIEKANKMHYENCEACQICIEELIPELKGSEDEKIRKELIAFLKENYETGRADKTWSLSGIERWIAWLEKQGENPMDKVKPKFNVGDTMRTLQEANDGYTDGMPVVVSIDNEHYHCNNELIAIKDQDDYEYPPMNRIQKPSWSEEDDFMATAVENSFYLHCGQMSDGLSEQYKKFFEKVKSLRPQNRWKPSDEQMEALWETYKCGEEQAALASLYSDLKKLRGE